MYCRFSFCRLSELSVCALMFRVQLSPHPPHYCEISNSKKKRAKDREELRRNWIFYFFEIAVDGRLLYPVVSYRTSYDTGTINNN